MYIGIDIGGTNIRIGAFKDLSGNPPESTKSFLVNNDFNTSTNEITNSIVEISHEENIEGIGIGIPGDPDEDGTIKGFDNKPNWNGKNLKEAFSKFNTKIKISNDAKTATLGESLFGPGKDKNKFLYIIWGTGWGGAYVENKNILHIEPGHQIVVQRGQECTCGQKSCLEAYIGGWSFEKNYGKKPQEVRDDNIWNEVAKYASIGVHNTLMHFYESELIVFGGGIIRNQDFLIDKIKTNLKDTTTYINPPEIKLSALGEHTALYGAVGLFI